MRRIGVLILIGFGVVVGVTPLFFNPPPLQHQTSFSDDMAEWQAQVIQRAIQHCMDDGRIAMFDANGALMGCADSPEVASFLRKRKGAS